MTLPVMDSVNDMILFWLILSSSFFLFFLSPLSLCVQTDVVYEFYDINKCNYKHYLIKKHFKLACYV